MERHFDKLGMHSPISLSGRLSRKSSKPSTGLISPRSPTLSNATYCGFLNKQNPRGLKYSTKRRWFVLDNYFLYYFTLPEDLKPIGIIDLSLVTRMIIKSSLCFVLVTPKREWVLFANERSDLVSWVKCIRRAMESYQERGSGSGSDNELFKSAEEIPTRHIVSPSRQPSFSPPKRKALSPSFKHRDKAHKSVDKDEKPRIHLSNAPKSPSTLRGAAVQMERCEIKLKKLKNQVNAKEKDEMRILLQALCLPTERPFPNSEKQAALECDIHSIRAEISRTETSISVYNTELQIGHSGRINGGGRERKRMVAPVFN